MRGGKDSPPTPPRPHRIAFWKGKTLERGTGGPCQGQRRGGASPAHLQKALLFEWTPRLRTGLSSSAAPAGPGLRLGPAGEGKAEGEAGEEGDVRHHVQARGAPPPPPPARGSDCATPANAFVAPSRSAASRALPICRHENLFEYQCGFGVKLLPLPFQITGGRARGPVLRGLAAKRVGGGTDAASLKKPAPLESFLAPPPPGDPWLRSWPASWGSTLALKGTLAGMLLFCCSGRPPGQPRGAVAVPSLGRGLCPRPFPC